MLIAVTKTFDEDYMLMFEEEQVRKACEAEGCEKDMIEGCIANMKEGEDNCTCCYIRLINELKVMPERIPVIPK